MGLDDRRQATRRDSGVCPETVTHVLLLVILFVFIMKCSTSLEDSFYLNFFIVHMK